MTGHVDAESLALYAEGELGRGRTARVRAHLSGCPDCATTLAALADVTIQLSHVPGPAMPAAVTARLDAALNAEAAHRAAAPAPAPAPPSRPPRHNSRWSPAGLRILAGTAVTLVVAGGIGYALSQVSGSPSSSSASAPSRAARSAAPPPGHHSVQGAPFVSPGGTAEKPNTGSSSSPAYARSGTDYRRGTLAAQAKHQLGVYSISGVSGPHGLAPASVPAQVRDCARQLAHGHPLLLVDQARYQQRPAIIIVLGKPDTVIAVSHSCTPLHSARLP
jgi:hypothetical protein